MVIAVVAVFVIGYAFIAFEHKVHINKAASALAAGIIAWTIYVLWVPDKHLVQEALTAHFEGVAEILFFLLGAMTIVELIDAHGGFDVITNRIQTRSKRTLLWIIGITAFLLSSVLDNLTTTIVMVSLVRKLLSDRDDRLVFAGIIIIATNAGGAWTPIGDVTTTMLWIGGNITTLATIKHLFLPSLACLFVPLIVISPSIRGKVARIERGAAQVTAGKNVVFFLGIGALLFVPVFKSITHLPPFLGMLLGLSVLWITTEIMHRGKEHEHRTKLSVGRALQKIDSASVLFFLGILLCIAALDAVGVLERTAVFLNTTVKNEAMIVVLIGVISAVVDNVPLVAAAMGMYPLSAHPADSAFWQFLAYCAGTGGSMLIIGSAAGVAAMGMEKIDFLWYLKRISLLALLGYAAGIAVFLGERALFPSFF
ncbi:MAG: sodium:proton antiporter NhaD [Spirochaetota bacterium]